MADNWEKAKRIFAEAIKLSPELRLQYLNEACADDAETRHEVESLLSSHEEANSFMESPAVGGATDVISQTKSLESGKRFGHYEVIERIGAGGMGEVYLARDTQLDRNVALKALLPEIAKDKDRLRRFKLEAKAVSALNHPNIITIYEIGELDDRLFIAYEYIEGKTLREKIKRNQLTFSDSVKIAEQVANALVVAHKAGIVHRDIKPENIMIRQDGIVKILDFGLAKKRIFESPSEAETLHQTREGIIMGSPSYMSPEQARGKETDQRTDIWSLGVVLYEMLTGKNPFEGETISDSIAAILRAEIEPIKKVVEDIPVELQNIVEKSIKKDLSERYQNIEEFLEDLRNPRETLKDRISAKSYKQTLLNDKTIELKFQTRDEKPTTPTEEITRQKQEEKKKARTPKWLWITASLMSMFSFVIVIIALAWWFIPRTDFEVVIKNTPSGSDIKVNGVDWGVPTDDTGTIRLPGLAAETKRIEIIHPIYSCEPREIDGAKAAGETVEIIAACQAKKIELGDDCSNIGIGEEDKAERCARATLDALPDPPPIDDLLKALNIFIINFEGGKYNIHPAQMDFLRLAASYIQKLPPSTVIEIGGHTDSDGPEEINLTLSKIRADAVRYALISFGVKPKMLTAKGYGEINPKFPQEKTPLEKYKNRRIEFITVKR